MTVQEFLFQDDVLAITDVKMPIGSKILSCGKNPEGKLAIWVLADETAGREVRTVYCQGTSWLLDKMFKKYPKIIFVGSIPDKDNTWHIFITPGQEDLKEENPEPIEQEYPKDGYLWQTGTILF